MDSSDDENYEWLDITAQISVTKASTYNVSADLVTADGIYVVHVLTETVLSPGVRVVTLSFNGEDIQRNRTNGPYVLTRVMLVENDGVGLLLQKADSVYTTDYYNYNQFGSHQMYLPLIFK